MSDDYTKALTAAKNARPWLTRPTMPRDDVQVYEIGYAAGWDARAARTDEIRVSREILTRLLDGDPIVRAGLRRVLEGSDQR